MQRNDSGQKEHDIDEMILHCACGT